MPLRRGKAMILAGPRTAVRGIKPFALKPTFVPATYLAVLWALARLG
jgi:hypothetical protein